MGMFAEKLNPALALEAVGNQGTIFAQIGEEERDFGEDESHRQNDIEEMEVQDVGDDEENLAGNGEDHRESPLNETKQEVIKAGHRDDRKNEIGDDIGVRTIENRGHMHSSKNQDSIITEARQETLDSQGFTLWIAGEPPSALPLQNEPPETKGLPNDSKGLLSLKEPERIFFRNTANFCTCFLLKKKNILGKSPSVSKKGWN